MILNMQIFYSARLILCIYAEPQNVQSRANKKINQSLTNLPPLVKGNSALNVFNTLVANEDM